VSDLGHEDQFPPPTLKGGCRLGEATFAGMGGKEEDAPISAVHRTAMEQLESTQGVILLPQRLSRITGDISGIGRGLLRYTEFGRRSDNCIVIAE
jgi:hypothetical protein